MYEKRTRTRVRTQLVPLCTSATQISRPIRYVNLREFVIASRSTLRPSPRWFSLLPFALTSLFLSFYRAWAFNVPGDPNRRRTKPLRRKYSEYRTFYERTVLVLLALTIETALCLECHSRKLTTYVHALSETIRLWPPMNC